MTNSEAFSGRSGSYIRKVDAQMDQYDYQNRLLNILVKKLVDKSSVKWRFLVDNDPKYIKSTERSFLEASEIDMFAAPRIISKSQSNREHIKLSGATNKTQIPKNFAYLWAES